MSASAVETPTKGFKLKSFFRSRSRSRTRERMSSDLPSDPSPYLHPPLPPSSDNPPSSYLKSSRPISSTTTATHSTITPLPSDALRNRISRGRHAYAYQPQSTHTHTSTQDHDQSSVSCECDSNDHNFPRSETPSSSTRKLVLPSFFGISLTRRSSLSASTSERKGSPSTSTSEPRSKSSRKRSFRFASRPSTPKSVDESSSTTSPYSIPVPSSPLPLSASPRRRSFGLGSSQRSTPKSSSGHLPLPHALTTPSPRPHGRRHSVASERPPHDSAVALPEEPAHRNVHNSTHIIPDGGGRNKGKERERPLPNSETLLPDLRSSVNFISKSLPADPSPVSRNHLPSRLAGHSVFPHLSTVYSTTEDENDQPSFLAPQHIPPVPRIIHTPPTPQRPGEVDSPSMPNLLAVDPGGKPDTTKGKSVTIAHQEQILVSSSNLHTDTPRQPASSKSRFSPRFFSGKDSRKTKDSNTQKSSRRPAAASTPVSNIASPARSMTNHRSQLGSFDFERPVSALNREGSHISKDNVSYAKSSLHSLERTLDNDSARGGNSRVMPHDSGQSSVLSQSGLGHAADVSVMSFSSVSLQTKSTGKGSGSTVPAGQSSSWGRVSGRHVLRTSHGTFAFEHPSSVPNSPNPQTFNLPTGPNQNDLSGLLSDLAQSQPAAPSNKAFDAAKHSRAQSYNTSDYADPGYAKPGRRTPKGKGRSLDLGLGLSWAPSRLREEVLMPGLILSREKARQEKISTDGLDVTKVFESLLSHSRFQTFKKYVHRFDAHIIPLEGPTGLLARVEKLLTESGLGEQERSKLMSEFSNFVENHSG